MWTTGHVPTPQPPTGPARDPRAQCDEAHCDLRWARSKRRAGTPGERSSLRSRGSLGLLVDPPCGANRQARTGLSRDGIVFQRPLEDESMRSRIWANTSSLSASETRAEEAPKGERARPLAPQKASRSRKGETKPGSRGGRTLEQTGMGIAPISPSCRDTHQFRARRTPQTCPPVRNSTRSR